MFAALAIAEARILLERNGRTGTIVQILARMPAFSLAVPALALATGWFLILHATGLVTLGAPVVVIVVNLLMALPFALRVIEPALLAHHEAHDRLAASLGLTGLARIGVLDWPVLRPAILAALGFSMALSLGDFGVMAIFGSDGFITLPALLFAKLGSYRSSEADAIALVLALVSLMLAWPAARLETRKDRA